jgi:hypothetical protein
MLEDMNTSLVASTALLDGPGLVRMVRAFGWAAGTDEIGEPHLPLPADLSVAASLLCQAWAVSVSRSAIADLVGARRMPDMAASNTVLAINDEGRPAGATLLTPRFAAVAGDREAVGNPRAEIVADEADLSAWARARLFDEHLGLLVEALHDLAPLGRRLLWGNVAAATAGAFAILSAPSIPRAQAEHLLTQARLLLDWPGTPTVGLAEVFPVAHDGGVRLFVRRQTCCLRYRLPDAPPTCLSCRLVPERERGRRIALRLEAEVG